MLKALEPLLKSQDSGQREELTELYCKLATPDQVPTLIAILNQDKKSNNRQARDVMKTLARLKDPRGIDPIAARLVNVFTRGEARDALIAYGPAFENDIVKLLGHDSYDVRIVACEILKKTGTQNCLPALQQLATRDPEVLVRNVAKQAISEIQKRM